MSLGNTTETDVMNYIFDSAAPSWAANANFWIALHTADPAEAGTATTSEAAYTNYARVAVSRTTGFTVSGNQIANAALLQFPQSGGSGTDCSHFSIVTTASGAGQIILRGALASSLPTGSGSVPQFAIGALTATVD
jgi:hypothetical protein